MFLCGYRVQLTTSNTDFPHEFKTHSFNLWVFSRNYSLALICLQLQLILQMFLENKKEVSKQP